MRVLASDLSARTANSQALAPHLGASTLSPFCSRDLFFSHKRRRDDKEERAQHSADRSPDKPRLLHQTIPQI
jgi:hypothetical protein